MEFEIDFSRRRAEMVNQLRELGIHDAAVLQAFYEVPRHLFVPENLRHLAYENRPLPIGLSQTISQPYVVAIMLQALELGGEEKVLEIGTGSGYEAALLAKLAAEVHSIERLAALAAGAQRTLAELGIGNVFVHIGDGSEGLAAYAPYDAIISSAAALAAPEPWLAQLAEGGRLLLPAGEQEAQELQLWLRRDGELSRSTLGAVAFVPLIGKYGWAEEPSKSKLG